MVAFRLFPKSDGTANGEYFDITTVKFDLPAPLPVEEGKAKESVQDEEKDQTFLSTKKKNKNDHYFSKNNGILKRKYFHIINKLIGRAIVVAMCKWGYEGATPCRCGHWRVKRATTVAYRDDLINDTTIAFFRDAVTF